MNAASFYLKRSYITRQFGKGQGRFGHEGRSIKPPENSLGKLTDAADDGGKI
jgi:hypothetical protein